MKSIRYKFIANVYDLLDIIYFNNFKTSPRTGLLAYVPESSIELLEICIGTAANSIEIAENRPNTKIVGIDLSREMLCIANEKIKQRGVQNIETLQMDATHMNFEANRFDVVLISLVLHEVDENIRQAILKEASRVLKREGRCLIVEWHAPERYLQKCAFSVIRLLEPKGFKDFLSLDYNAYLEKFLLKVVSEKQFDYTRIIESIKK